MEPAMITDQVLEEAAAKLAATLDVISHRADRDWLSRPSRKNDHDRIRDSYGIELTCCDDLYRQLDDGIILWNGGA